ncbi:hypothetical protein A3F08_00015 [Candidatus Berkelbacteria bacterium RIFCSPHIGHO2_12_FULL_36_9]|uniref:Uncharacterized protein n=1 Tax=Candidatus Berkelbacteria bacterium RIFCSPHIGHO2_12_FULL_36_9 TaxID=1797469 RepID=A0A1F5EEK7_9BACT|nr:MAG: hypothetical protein A3F08_00015 [Candidatus Berkelbacteria bacterium RIFCSPHIGHO2_12_FULL_36_9]
MDYYEKGRYSRAIKEFEATLRLYPNLVEAQDYLKKSQEGLSNQPLLAKIADYLSDTTTLIIVIVVIVIVVVGVIAFLKMRKKEQKMEEKVEQLEHEK